MATGSATLDFGATPTDEASVLVTGQTALGAADHVEAFVMRETTADNGLEEHEGLAVHGRFVCDNDAAGDQFTIRAHLLAGFATGQFNVRWVYAA
jgi:hypothetical protein